MSSNKYDNITHVIFDMDGLLLNTEDLYTIAFQNVCSKYNKVYNWDIKHQIMGKKQEFAAKFVIDTLNLPLTTQEWFEKAECEYNKVFPTANLLPGAEKLVRHLKDKNIPIAISTGSSKFAFGLKTTNHKDFFDLFGHIVLCGDDPDVKHGKPHPDAYLVACSRFQPTPDAVKVLVFEDAPNGVKSAIAAGMQVVYIPHEEMPDLGDCGATLKLRTLEEFVPEQFGLPAY